MQTLDIAGIRCYATSREFDTAEQARASWEVLQAAGRKRKGKMDLGVYRHGPEGSPGTFVSAVSLMPGGVEYAERTLGGREHQLREHEITAMIARRAEVVVDLRSQDAPGGTYAIKRGSRGAYLRPDGSMDERTGEG